MTTELRRPSKYRAILVMLFTVTTFKFVASKSIFKPDYDTETPTGQTMYNHNFVEIATTKEAEDATVLSADNYSNNFHEKMPFLKYRHWYNKPRRKQVGWRASLERDPFFSDVTQGTKKSLKGELFDTDSMSSRTMNPHARQSPGDIALKARQKRGDSGRARTARSVARFSPLPSSNSQSGGTATAFIWPGSRRNEDLWKQSYTHKKLYHKTSSMMLQINVEGEVSGVSRSRQDCGSSIILSIKGVGWEGKQVVVKIYSELSKRYLALGRNGQLYTTKSASNLDTDFLHEYFPSSHDAYLSRQHRLYVTLRDDGRPMKSRTRNGSSNSTPKRALFITSNISDDCRREHLESGTATSVAVVATGESQQGESTAEKNKSGLPGSARGESSEISASRSVTAGKDLSSATTVVEPSPVTALPDTKTSSPRLTNSPRGKRPKKRCEGGKKCCKKRKKGSKKGRCRRKKNNKGKGRKKGGKGKGKNRRKPKSKKRLKRSLRGGYLKDLYGKRKPIRTGIDKLDGEEKLHAKTYLLNNKGEAVSRSYARDAT